MSSAAQMDELLSLAKSARRLVESVEKHAPRKDFGVAWVKTQVVLQKENERAESLEFLSLAVTLHKALMETQRALTELYRACVKTFYASTLEVDRYRGILFQVDHDLGQAKELLLAFGKRLGLSG